jgi:hypothetical protein
MKIVAVMVALTCLGAAPLHAQKRARPDTKAVEAAKQLVQKRTSPDEVAAQMARNFRQDPGQTAAILNSLRLSSDVTGQAVRSAYRTSGQATVEALTTGGFGLSDVVSASTKLRISGGDMVPGLADAGVSTRDAVAALRAGGVALDAIVPGLRKSNVPAREMLQVLAPIYTDRSAVDLGLVARNAGYVIDAPRIDGFFIADYRQPGNDRIKNVGIVDPRRVPGTGHPKDGEVTIEGEGLDLPGTRVLIVHDRGETEGQIVSASSNQLLARFEDFESGELRVETPGGQSSTPVVVLTHVTRNLAQVFTPEPQLSFAGNSVVGVWGAGGSSHAETVGSVVPGLSVSIVGLDPNPDLALLPSPGRDGCIRAVFSMPVVVNGTVPTSIKYWACGSFELPQSDCHTVTAQCIAQNLADAMSSLASCVNPENWSEEERTGPPAPVHGEGVSVTTLSANFEVLPNGSILTTPGGFEHTGAVLSNVPISGVGAPIPGISPAWWEAQVVPHLLAMNIPYAEAVGNRLDDWPIYLPELAGMGLELRGIYAQQDGTLLFDLGG